VVVSLPSCISSSHAQEEEETKPAGQSEEDNEKRGKQLVSPAIGVYLTVEEYY